jgi:hypothetical protein
MASPDNQESLTEIQKLRNELKAERCKNTRAANEIKRLQRLLHPPSVGEAVAMRCGWKLWILDPEPRVVRGSPQYIEYDGDEPPMPLIYDIDGPHYDDEYTHHRLRPITDP